MSTKQVHKESQNHGCINSNLKKKQQKRNSMDVGKSDAILKLHVSCANFLPSLMSVEIALGKFTHYDNSNALKLFVML